MGGHVIFSHYQYFDELIDAAVGSGPDFWNTLERVSYVWIKNRWVAYPFQNNVSALPKEDQVSRVDLLLQPNYVSCLQTWSNIKSGTDGSASITDQVLDRPCRCQGGQCCGSDQAQEL